MIMFNILIKSGSRSKCSLNYYDFFSKAYALPSLNFGIVNSYYCSFIFKIFCSTILSRDVMLKFLVIRMKRFLEPTLLNACFVPNYYDERNLQNPWYKFNVQSRSQISNNLDSMLYTIKFQYGFQVPERASVLMLSSI